MDQSQLENKKFIMKNKLIPKTDILSFLGACCKDADILRDNDIELRLEDFFDPFYKVIFGALRNISSDYIDIKRINEVDIDTYLSKYPSQYMIWNKNKGVEVIQQCLNLDNENNYKRYYDVIKKYSLLYQLEINGIDTTSIYDPDLTDLKLRAEMQAEFEKMSLDQIIQKITMKVNAINEIFSDGSEVIRFKAGDDIENVLSRVLNESSYGYPYANGFYNDLFRGMRKKKYMLRSAGTGTGKTRQALKDMLDVSVPEMFDVEKNMWVDNNGSYPALFISTELEKDELQITMIAIVSGVNEDIISDGIYTKDVKARIDKAIELLKDAPFYCEYVNDFNIRDIEIIIETNIIKHEVEYVAFDYIQITPKLSRTMAEQYKMALREDQMLVYFSEALKQIANKYGIYLTSSTQVNRQVKEYEFRDASGLRGGQATADKVDTGILTFFANGRDVKNLKDIISIGYEKPNFSHWVFKNRGGKKMMCIVWTIMNLGNMRERPLFVTDYDFNLLDDIKIKEILFSDDDKKVETVENDLSYRFKTTLPNFEQDMYNQLPANF